MAAIKELTRDLENKATDFRKLEKDIQKNQQVKKKYTIQLGENELVLKELDLLNDDTNVYKLIGPVLVKQDLAEANANVRKRIEYISAELYALLSLLMFANCQATTKNPDSPSWKSKGLICTCNPCHLVQLNIDVASSYQNCRKGIRASHRNAQIWPHVALRTDYVFAYSLLDRDLLDFGLVSVLQTVFVTDGTPLPVRLACVKHTTSVHPEPGSNSP
ncbi:hypothetical protein SASPL_124118 [Salvia splendens]|uniref:Prefoldin beta subunit n=1 Tax=Salvia splendens TaxID=180675 RepID=A0A8X8ZTU9_SALSN|nr:hypothetical protein SASPL_124118 [Salvia splendens]